ncbi:hypothetical protein V1511DRAFT_500216 [Dipodascopsis uninucleata]
MANNQATETPSKPASALIAASIASSRLGSAPSSLGTLNPSNSNQKHKKRYIVDAKDVDGYKKTDPTVAAATAASGSLSTAGHTVSSRASSDASVTPSIISARTVSSAASAAANAASSSAAPNAGTSNTITGARTASVISASSVATAISAASAASASSTANINNNEAAPKTSRRSESGDRRPRFFLELPKENRTDHRSVSKDSTKSTRQDLPSSSGPSIQRHSPAPSEGSYSRISASSPAQSIRSTKSRSLSLASYSDPRTADTSSEQNESISLSSSRVSDTESHEGESGTKLLNANILTSSLPINRIPHYIAEADTSLKSASDGALIAAKLVAQRNIEETKLATAAAEAAKTDSKAAIPKRSYSVVLHSPIPRRVIKASVYKSADQPHENMSNRDFETQEDRTGMSAEARASVSDGIEMARSESAPIIKIEEKSSNRTDRKPKIVYVRKDRNKSSASLDSSKSYVEPSRYLDRSKVGHSHAHSSSSINLRRLSLSKSAANSISSGTESSKSSLYHHPDSSLSVSTLPYHGLWRENGGSPFSTASTPTKIFMRSTMRKPPKPKRMFNADKPWKHLIISGTPTETEKKRYGALWAANRGTLLPSDLSHCVQNLVVKRIWERSRLSRETLEKVWDLVCKEPRGYLTKDEFLVGTWIIDQCLYGRKLPQKLSPDIWSGINLGVSLSPVSNKHHHSHGSHHRHKKIHKNRNGDRR